MPVDDSTSKRFWAKVCKDGPTILHMETPCWMWTAARHSKGYGIFGIAKKTTRAHRLAFAWAGGDARDLLVLHDCDNPSCVNPSHLRAGTAADNSRDSSARNRTRCPITNEDAMNIRLRAERGETGAGMAREYGVLPQTISGIIHGRVKLFAGGPIRRWSVCVRHGGGFAMPDADVRNIRERASRGERAGVLAEEFGVSRTYVRRIIRGTSRKGAGGPLGRRLK
uniref:Putative bacteriophage t7-related protein n=1 Tax=uncultured marine virus TaxID=186617 RepID=A0A0F7LAE0_9VIRU|nr:putative bacteriophage t7-related protein [uncultured marine virus]